MDDLAKKPLMTTDFISRIIINQINAAGKPIEKWTLHDAFVKSINFGELAYADDELVEITIGISYDYATLE